jgi:hypothetical protein
VRYGLLAAVRNEIEARSNIRTVDTRNPQVYDTPIPWKLSTRPIPPPMRTCSYCGKNYPDDFAVCPVDATPLEVLPEPPQIAVVTAQQPAKPLLPVAFPAREALVTLAVLVVCLVAQKFPLPTLPKPTANQPLFVNNSILLLGIQPVLFAFVLVELAALLIPPWRPLRTGGRVGREKLRNASSVLGLLLALGQASFVAVALQATASGSYGAGSLALTVLILLGATAALIGLARIVDEEGLGGGFPVLLLAFTLPGLTAPVAGLYSAVQAGALPGSVLTTGAIGLFLLVGATLWFFSPYSLPPANEPWEHPNRLSRPACGVAPLNVIIATVAFAMALVRANTRQRISYSHEFDLVQVVLGIFAAIGFAYLFNSPDRFSVVWKALSPLPPERLPRIKSVMLECIFFVIVVFVVQAWLNRVLGSRYSPDAIPVILVTGILTDLVREWRAKSNGMRLVQVWEIHQVYAVPPVMSLLQARGFHPFPKGLRLRSLLQFFGPYAPILVLVPAEEAQAAHALLESRWPVLDPP